LAVCLKPTWPQLGVGDRVQHDLLVVDRAESKTNAGDPFVRLTLGDPSGRIETAPIWSDKLTWVDGVESGRVVQVIGNVSLYGKNGSSRRQLTVTAPIRVLPKGEDDAERFLPRVAADLTKLWDWMDRTRGEVESATLRRVLDLFFGDDDFRVRFEKTPAPPAGTTPRWAGCSCTCTRSRTSPSRRRARCARRTWTSSSPARCCTTSGRSSRTAWAPAASPSRRAGCSWATWCSAC
jgi:hypothetical protein